MEEVSSLVIKVSSDDVAKASKNLDDLTKASDRVMGYIKGLVTAAAALSIFKSAADAIAAFSHELVGIQAVTRATTSEMHELAEFAKDMGAKTRFSAQEAAAGMKFLGQAGFTTSQIVAAMPGLLELATAGELDLATAADITSAALAGFRLQASESARVADVLAVAAGESNTSVAQMGDALKYVAPIGASLNITIEQISAALGVLSNAGLQGSMAGTGLRQVLSSLASPTKEAADTLRAYGIAIDDVNPQTRSLSQVIEALKKGGLDAAAAFTIFGDRGAPAILALTSQTGNLEKLNQSLAAAKGRAGEMAHIMGDDLTGDILKLKNSTNALYISLGDAGLNGVLRDVTQSATTFVRQIDDLVKSGEAAAWVDVFKSKLLLLSDGFINASENIAQTWALTMDFLAHDGKEGADNIVDAFKNMPENIRAMVQLGGNSLGTFVSYAEAAGRGIADSFSIAWSYIVVSVKNYSREAVENFKAPFLEFGIWIRESQISIAESLNKILPDKNKYGESFFGPLRADLEKYKASLADTKNNFWDNQIKASADATTAFEHNWSRVKDGLSEAADAWEKEVETIMNERDANVKASDDKLKKIDELRAAYAKLKAAREAAQNEAAAKGGVVGKAADNPAPEHFNVEEFDALRKKLQLEEATIDESYQRRLELIRKNTKAGSVLRLQLEKELEAQVTIEREQAETDRANKVLQLEQELAQAMADGRQSLVDGLQFQLEHEEQRIAESYDRRRQLILASTELTETQKAAKIAAINAQQLQVQREIETARNKQTLKYATDFLGNLATIAGAFGAKGARIAKAAAIIQTTVKTYESATSAYAALAGIPYVGPALGAAAAAAAVAAGLANVAAIKSQGAVPAYEHGGMIPAGGVGLAGETGVPELVRGPAVVTSARTMQDNGLLKGGGTNVTVNVNNDSGVSSEVTQQDGPDGKIINIITKRIKSELNTDLKTGGSPWVNTMQSVFKLNRGAA